MTTLFQLLYFLLKFMLSQGKNKFFLLTSGSLAPSMEMETEMANVKQICAVRIFEHIGCV